MFEMFKNLKDLQRQFNMGFTQFAGQRTINTTSLSGQQPLDNLVVDVAIGDFSETNGSREVFRAHPNEI